MIDAIPDERLLNLVRHQRHELHNSGLITDEEYAFLVEEGSAKKLETYDEMRARIDLLSVQVQDLNEACLEKERECARLRRSTSK